MEWMLDYSAMKWLLGSTVTEGSLTYITALLAMVVIMLWWRGSSNKNQPPGPWGLPLVGYLPWIDPKAPHLTLSKLVDRYGRIFKLDMGGVPVVVMSDYKVIRETLNLKSTTGRAPLYLTHGIMKGYGLICAEGWLWRDHRKFVAGFMRDQGMRAAASRADMEPRIHSVARILTQELSNCRDPVDISAKLLHHVGNTMNQLVFGLTYSDDDPTWRWLRHLLEEGTKLVGVAGPMNFLPWLRFLPTYKRVIRFITENQHKTHQEYQKIIDAKEKSLKNPYENLRSEEGEEEEEEEEVENKKTNEDNKIRMNADPQDVSTRPSHADDRNHEMQSTPNTNLGHNGSLESQDENSTNQDIDLKDYNPQNIVEAYIKERSERGEDVGSFTYEQLHHVAADLFGAGSETTITTLKWHLLNMALFPHIQTRVQEELDDCAGGSEHVMLDQASILPFTNACIMETQRLRSIVPLGIPHGASEDLTIAGYDISAGTMLLPLLWFVHHDPTIWDNPDQYIPERFLNEDGQLIRQHPAFMPFQTGRRMCIGDEFAKMILFIFTTRILLQFRVNLEEEDLHKDPAKDPICGISLCPRPFKLVFTPRPRH